MIGQTEGADFFDDDLAVYAVDEAKRRDVLIFYGDALRRKTGRVITPLRLAGHLSPCGSFLDIEYIEAHCHLRDATRTFRLDRIKEAADPETGEVLSTAEFVARMPPYIEPASDPDPPVEALAVTGPGKAPKALAEDQDQRAARAARVTFYVALALLVIAAASALVLKH
ncbi:MAG: hypothetical protein KGL48_14060 [Sphingomonadales bacterium]|nr:hypothetical protein [Sphingomonadales bacterium]